MPRIITAKGINQPMSLMGADDTDWLRAQARVATNVVDRFDDVADRALLLQGLGIDERIVAALERA